MRGTGQGVPQVPALNEGVTSSAGTGELGLGKNTLRRALQKDTCCSSWVCFLACRRIPKIFQKLLIDWSLVLCFKGTCCMDRLAPKSQGAEGVNDLV